MTKQIPLLLFLLFNTVACIKSDHPPSPSPAREEVSQKKDRTRPHSKIVYFDNNYGVVPLHPDELDFLNKKQWKVFNYYWEGLKDTPSRLFISENGTSIQEAQKKILATISERKTDSKNKKSQSLWIMDTTKSMSGTLQKIQEMHQAAFEIQSSQKNNHEMAILTFKDKLDETLTKKVLDFDTSSQRISLLFSKLEGKGGGDSDEAVETALETGTRDFSWQANSLQNIILVTDAKGKRSSLKPVISKLEAVQPGIFWMVLLVLP